MEALSLEIERERFQYLEKSKHLQVKQKKHQKIILEQVLRGTVGAQRASSYNSWTDGWVLDKVIYIGRFALKKTNMQFFA